MKFITAAASIFLIVFVSDDSSFASGSEITNRRLKKKSSNGGLKGTVKSKGKSRGKGSKKDEEGFGSGGIKERADSEDDVVAYIKTASPTMTPSTSPTGTPSLVPSTSPTGMPSSAPTVSRLCNVENEKECRNDCLEELKCGNNENCKRRCRDICCSWKN